MGLATLVSEKDGVRTRRRTIMTPLGRPVVPLEKLTVATCFLASEPDSRGHLYRDASRGLPSIECQS